MELEKVFGTIWMRMMRAQQAPSDQWTRKLKPAAAAWNAVSDCVRTCWSDCAQFCEYGAMNG